MPKAHLYQLDIVWEDKAANHEKVRELTEYAQPDPGDLLVLPELFDAGFTLNTKAAADTQSETLDFLRSLANDTGCFVHGARAIDADQSGKLLNQAVVIEPGRDEPLCAYSKIHPFSFGREEESYAGGHEIQTYGWTCGSHACSMGPAVCYDLRFPELFRAMAKQGAQAFVLGANWPTHRQHHWRALCVARAIENQAWMIAVNRTGHDPHLPYAGGSLVVDPMGEIVAELDDEEAVCSVEIDPKASSAWRKQFPALRDIRVTDLDSSSA